MELLNYLLKVSACTVLFFAFYLLVLRRLTFFKTNRFYLLFTLMLSFLIPLLNFTIEREVEAVAKVEAPIELQQEQYISSAMQSPMAVDENLEVIREPFDWWMLLRYLYGAIVFVLISLAIWRLFQLLKHTKKGSEKINGLKIVSKTGGFTNCSFFNYVFIDESLTEAELQVLLKHEEVHAKQFHSIDKIILILAKAVLWFNPIAYLYDKALEQAHEYEADEATSQNVGTELYANLLLRLAISKSEMPLVHNFVKSPIKERIKMLFSSKSKHMKKLMYLLAIPIGLGLLWGFTVKVVEIAKPANDKSSSNSIKPIDKQLWGKTLQGKIKSILQTEVGELLNFKYGENTVEIYNHAKGKVKLGDELLVTISGTVDDIRVTDVKGNIIKRLERPCYGMSKLSKLNGEVLYERDDSALKKQINTQLKITKQDTTKLKRQKALEQKKKYEAFRKSPEFAKKLQEMKAVNGKTLTGIIGDVFESGGILVGKGKLLKVGSKTYVLEGFTKGNIINSLIKNDKVTIVVDYSSFNIEVPYLIISAKTITKDGKLLYTAAPRPKPQNYAFLYEANKARYAWSKIKSIQKNGDGTINKIILNDKGFTINLNVADQKFKSQNFIVGDSVIVKFFGEKLVAKNTYTTDKMIVLYSWPKKFELKNKTLFDKFYHEDGTQKVKENKVASINSTIESAKPILLRAEGLKVDTKSDISYIKNGVMKIGNKQLDAEEMTFDKRNLMLTAKRATVKAANNITITGNDLVYDFKKGTYNIVQAQSKTTNSGFLNIANGNKIKYHATDSIILNRKDEILALYGNATIANDKIEFKGSEIIYNGKLNRAKIKNAIYSDFEKNTITSDLIEVDFNKLTVYSKGVVKLNQN